MIKDNLPKNYKLITTIIIMKTYNLSTYITSIVFFAVIFAFSIFAIPALADSDENNEVGVELYDSISDLEVVIDAVIDDIDDIDNDFNNDTGDAYYNTDDDEGGDIEDANDLEEEEKSHKKRGNEHRSAVAELVKELKITAGKDGGIGEEVRQIAQEQEDSLERVAETIENIGKRGKFTTFLIGTDYKNIGALRSELVTAENHINRLEKAIERIEIEDTKIELAAEIETLNEVKANTELFIKENEDKFSLFGWFVKLFN